MHDIICPHCGKAFQIDEAGYADILKQVRDSAFEKDLHERLELAERDKQAALALARAQAASEQQKSAAAKDAAIQDLKGKLDAAEVARQLAVTQALVALEKERDALAAQLAQTRQEQQAAARLASGFWRRASVWIPARWTCLNLMHASSGHSTTHRCQSHDGFLHHDSASAGIQARRLDGRTMADSR